MLKAVTLRCPSNTFTSSKLGNCNLWLEHVTAALLWKAPWGFQLPLPSPGLLAVLLHLAPCCSSMLQALVPRNLAALDCQLLALAPGTDQAEGMTSRKSQDARLIYWELGPEIVSSSTQNAASFCSWISFLRLWLGMRVLLDSVKPAATGSTTGCKQCKKQHPQHPSAMMRFRLGLKH